LLPAGSPGKIQSAGILTKGEFLMARAFRFLKFCILPVVLLPLSGCVLDYSEHGSRGVSLSQAMKASASGGGQPLSGRSSDDEGPSVRVDTAMAGAASGGGGEVEMVDYGNWTYQWQVPMDVAYSVPLNGEIQSLTRFTLTPIAMETDHHYIGLFVAGDIVQLQPGSLPDRATDNVWMFESGIAYRYYFTPAHAFFSPYFSANAAFQLLSWDYRNPITVNGDTVTDDSLEAVGGYAGLGLAIKRNSHLSFFGEAGFGGTAFLGTTTQGFDNDVFSDFGYFSVKAGLTLKF
jgi:hypothetical protein